MTSTTTTSGSNERKPERAAWRESAVRTSHPS